jgi:hypothetical protein
MRRTGKGVRDQLLIERVTAAPGGYMERGVVLSSSFRGFSGKLGEGRLTTPSRKNWIRAGD